MNASMTGALTPPSAEDAFQVRLFRIRIQLQALLDVVEVMRHQRLRLGYVAALDRGEDLFVLVGAAARRRRRVVQRDDQAGEDGQLAHRARQRRVAGELGEQHVELARQAHDRALVVALAPVPARRGSFAPPPVKPNVGLPEAIARLLARGAGPG